MLDDVERDEADFSDENVTHSCTTNEKTNNFSLNNGDVDMGLLCLSTGVGLEDDLSNR